MSVSLLVRFAVISIWMVFMVHIATTKGGLVRRAALSAPRTALRLCGFAVRMWWLRLQITSKALLFGNVRLAWGSISGIEVHKLSR
jgi:hypothetical protein